MIQSYWMDVVNSRCNSNYKYFWWRTDYKQQLKKLLQQKWTNDLLNFELNFFFLISKIYEVILIPQTLQIAHHISRGLLQIKKNKNKELKRQKRHRTMFYTVKRLRF